MNDHLGLFGRPSEDETGELNLTDLRAALAQTATNPVPSPRRSVPRREQRAARQAAARRRKRRIRQTVAAVLVLGVIVAGVVVGFSIWRKDANVIADFAGPGDTDTIVRILSGDSRNDIADTLVTDHVVASTDSFLDASANNADIRSLAPGFYKVKQHASAVAALDAITDPTARVGQLRLIPGRQLADVSTTAAAGGTKTGYITAITDSACVPMNGVSNCFTADQLLKVAETASPAELGVPSWATAGVQAAPEPAKRLEGLLVPGDYSVQPGSDPLQVLNSVISQSAAAWNTNGLVSGAKAIDRTPYQVAVMASLIELEGSSSVAPLDMSKISRVIYNRLAKKMPLEFDSTVNYGLNRAQISTTRAERTNPASPYNTYAHTGLPPTPISSPGATALNAALNPDEGDWLFFVKVDKKGNSCFSVTNAEHEKCVAKARANGVFDE